MSDVCGVRRYVLDVAVDVMLGLASVAELVDERAEIHHGKCGFFIEFFDCMYPHVDIPITLTDWILSQCNFFSLAFLPTQLARLTAHLLVVLH